MKRLARASKSSGFGVQQDNPIPTSHEASTDTIEDEGASVKDEVCRRLPRSRLIVLVEHAGSGLARKHG